MKSSTYSLSSAEKNKAQTFFFSHCEPGLLTRIHDGLPLAAPLAELLGVLPFHTGPLVEAGHEVIAGPVGLLGSVHRGYIIPRLEEQHTAIIESYAGQRARVEASGWEFSRNAYHPEAAFGEVLSRFLGEARHGGGSSSCCCWARASC